jgi:hypothetical protein
VVFGGTLTNEETREVAVRLTTELLFDMSIDRQAEIGFVSFMFVCGESMFVVPEKAAVQLRRCGEQLVVFEGTLSRSLDGSRQFKIEQTDPFPIPRFDLFFKDQIRKKAETRSAVPALAELGAKVAAARLGVGEVEIVVRRKVGTFHSG